MDDESRTESFQPGALRNGLAMGRRPHAIFGSKELVEGRLPLFLPALQAQIFEQYHPAKGKLSTESDRTLINQLVEANTRHFNALKDNYDGEVNSAGEPHGYGKMVYSSGKVYEGEFIDGRFHGYGKCFYAHWDAYEGDWRNGKRHGVGQQTYGNGDVVYALWKDGQIAGKWIDDLQRSMVANGQITDFKTASRADVEDVTSGCKEQGQAPKNSRLHATV